MEASGNKAIYWELAKSVPHLYQSFPLREYANDDGLGEGIENLFEESDDVLEEMIETSFIRDAKPEERVPNFTFTQLMVPCSFW